MSGTDDDHIVIFWINEIAQITGSRGRARRSSFARLPGRA
jgi:hypothetical protein